MLEALCHVLHLTGLQWYETPRTTQACVIDVEKHPHLFFESAAVKRSHRDPKSLLNSRYHHAKFCIERGEHRHLAPESIEIFYFPKSIFLNESTVKGWVVRHHKKWSRMKSFDEQTALIIERRVCRPANRLHALSMQPFLGGIEQCACGRTVILALKKTEEAALFGITLDMNGIHYRCDTSYVFAIASR